MNRLILFLSAILLYSCAQDNTPLPVLGETKIIDGQEVKHEIPDFEFYNQDSVLITNRSLQGAYVADFFFVSCPSICPIVTKEMLRIHDAFADDPLQLVSYTMDPKRDTVARLKDYAGKLEVDAPKWHFLTGDKKKLHNIATDYFNVVIEDDEAPGGFNHTGKIILVDKDRHIRAFCEGTDPEDVTDFIKDVKKLLAENEE